MRTIADLSKTSQVGVPKRAPLKAPSIALSHAIESLVAGDFQARWEISKQLPEFGEDAIAPLLTLSQDTTLNSELRWFAIRALGSFQTPQVVAALASLVKTTDDDLRDIAIKTLADMGETSIQALTDLLTYPEQRPLAVQALSQIRQTAVIEPLLEVANDDDPSLRYLAIEALGSFHDQRITPLLLSALSDTHAQIRQEAIATLGRRPDLRDPHGLIARLRDCLWDLNLAVCKAATAAIGRLGGAGAETALRQLLVSSTTPDDLKIQAVRALGWLQTEAALQVLAEALNLKLYPDLICKEIIKALGQTQSPLQPLAIAELHQLLTHPQLEQASTDIKQSLAMSLGNLRADTTFDNLTALLADADQRIRLHTLAALKQIAPQAGHHRIRALLTQSPLPSALQTEIEESLDAW
ncbi:MAG: HEAT repeat domain-containing protein [Cyanobacteria bacterium P01_G01_bin.38]